MNREVWSLGVEDGSFPTRQTRGAGFKTLLVAVLLKELQLRQVNLRRIAVDGTDATEALLSILTALEPKPETLFLAGISYAGFNFIDPFRLQKETNLPSIIITTEKPNNQAVQKALKRHFPDWKERWSIYKRLTNFPRIKANPNENPVFMETVGLTVSEGEVLVKRLTKNGRLPEPLRVARMIARGLSTEAYLGLINS